MTNLKEVNISFLQGNSIHEAARQGDLDTVRCLIDEGTDANIKDDDAARQGRLDTVKHLIDKGTDVDPRDDDGVSQEFIPMRV